MKHHGPPRLQREHVHCPVTALAFFKSSHGGPVYILSGEDTHLKIYDTVTQRLCASVQVFTSQPIHGISTGINHGVSADILVWGGSSVTCLSRAETSTLLLQGPRNVDDDDHDGGDGGDGRADKPFRRLAVPEDRVVQAPDWIYDGAVCPSRPDLGAVVTAHNEVIPLHISPVGMPGGDGLGDDEGVSLLPVLGRPRHPPSRPILYSAQVCWTGEGEGEVLVAAGTVFGEIIVWRSCVTGPGPDDAHEKDAEVLFVFSGHEGSIFGVDMSPEMVVPGTQRRLRLLASCSDDRTIRVWDISEGSGRRLVVERGRDRDNRSFTEARETGFGDNSAAVEARADRRSSKPLAVVMGHLSRIWQVRFSLQGHVDSTWDPRGSLSLYSFGEDGTAQRWRLDLDGPGVLELHDEQSHETRPNGPAGGYRGPAAELTHQAIIHGHNGKHIWSSAVSGPMSPSMKSLVATGGSDGKINLVEEVAEVSEASTNNPSVLAISGPDVLAKLPADNDTSSHDRQDEPFHMYALLSESYALATTATGRILCGTLGGAEVSWTEVPVPKPIRDDLQRYQVVRSAGLGAALLGSTSGQLYIYNDGEIRAVYRMPGKIADIFPLTLKGFQGLGVHDVQSKQTSLVPIVLTVMKSSQVRILLLDRRTASKDTVLYDSLVELEKGFIPTAAGCCSEYLIFGSRTGVILVYKLDVNGCGFQQVARINRPLSKDAVSFIVALPPKAGSPSSPYFLTTSRDGRYRIYEITNETSNTDAAIVHMRHEAVPPLGPMIEGALFTSSPNAGSELLLCGFRSKDFIVWNETRQLEVSHVECGGGHRSFTYRVDPEHPERVSFIWTRASRTHMYVQNSVPQRPLRPGGHGREIKAVASHGDYLATGAEDTNLRIWRYDGASGGDDREGPLSCLAVVEKHTAGIQCLKWAGDKYVVSSSGNEELFVWRITDLDSAYDGLAVVCEGAYPDRTRDGDLRIMSFDVEALPPPPTEQEGAGHERGGGAEVQVLYLSVVLSNSTLRTYRYSKAEGFALIAQGRYTGACPTQIRHLRIAQGEGDGEVHILTASTDGHVALWKTAEAEAEAEYALVEVSRLHQSSIKALGLRPLPRSRAEEEVMGLPSSYVVVTGGDDSAIGHVHLEWAGGNFRISSRSLANGAHAAAITGLCITDAYDVDRHTPKATYHVELCTASNDQRVRRWRMTVDDTGTVRKMSLVANEYSSIADCGDVDLLDGRRVVVAGVGMEVWRL